VNFVELPPLPSSSLRLVRDTAATVAQHDDTAKVRSAVDCLVEHQRAHLARGDRRGALACAKQARAALTEIAELIALVGLHLPVHAPLQKHIDRMLEAFEQAGTVKGELL